MRHNIIMHNYLLLRVVICTTSNYRHPQHSLTKLEKKIMKENKKNEKVRERGER